MSKKNPWKKLTEAQKEKIAKVFADAWLSLPAGNATTDPDRLSAPATEGGMKR